MTRPAGSYGPYLPHGCPADTVAVIGPAPGARGRLHLTCNGHDQWSAALEGVARPTKWWRDYLSRRGLVVESVTEPPATCDEHDDRDGDGTCDDPARTACGIAVLCADARDEHEATCIDCARCAAETADIEPYLEAS